jgi:hypothetical protein
MTDDQLLLASAYLDDVLDEPQRARAEADPEVMAEVVRLGELRTLLRDVEPADQGRRERAIAAALRAGRGDDPALTAPAVPLRSRRRWWTAAGVAAAVLGLAVTGIVVGGRVGEGDDDSASVASTTAGVVAQDRAAAPAPAAASATTAAGAAATAGAGTESAQAGGTAAAPSGSAPAPTTPVQIDSPAALAAFATTTSSLQQASSTGADTCGGGRYVGRATYGSGHVAVEVFVAGADAVARDATTCAEVARAAIP